MAVLIHFTPAAMSAAQYDEAMRRLEAGGTWPPPGLIHHTCFGSKDKLNVIDVWETQAQFEAFGQRLLPILADIGFNPGQPAISPVHNEVNP